MGIASFYLLKEGNVFKDLDEKEGERHEHRRRLCKKDRVLLHRRNALRSFLCQEVSRAEQLARTSFQAGLPRKFQIRLSER